MVTPGEGRVARPTLLTLLLVTLHKASGTPSHLSPTSQRAQLLPWQALEVLGVTLFGTSRLGEGGTLLTTPTPSRSLTPWVSGPTRRPLYVAC